MKQYIISLFILLSALIIACKSEVETPSKAKDTILIMVSSDSIDLKLMKIYNISTLEIQDVKATVAKNKNFTFTEKLDKLLLCFVTSDYGATSFYIEPNINRTVEVKINDTGRLELIFDKEDYINIFNKLFSEKRDALLSIQVDENNIISAIEKTKRALLSKLEEIKSKINNSSYKTLKAMVVGKTDHIKFLFSERFKDLTYQSDYYDFTDSLDFDNDYYLTYSDNLNTLYSTLAIQYERKYNSSFTDASNKLEFINEFIKNDEVRSQITCFIVSREIPRKTEQEKQAILSKLEKLKIKEQYLQHIIGIDAGTALGAKVGNQAKYLETLVSKNKNFNIERLNGKLLYIDNWATWCGPCVKSMKSFLTKYNELTKIKDVVFVFVSFDRNESIWRKYLAEKNFPEKNIVHLYNDSGMKSAYSKYYNILELPRYFVVDKSGIVKDLNPPTASDKDFEQFIKKTASL